MPLMATSAGMAAAAAGQQQGTVIQVGPGGAAAGTAGLGMPRQRLMTVVNPVSGAQMIVSAPASIAGGAGPQFPQGAVPITSASHSR
jgi:hypothetical protein